MKGWSIVVRAGREGKRTQLKRWMEGREIFEEGANCQEEVKCRGEDVNFKGLVNCKECDKSSSPSSLHPSWPSSTKQLGDEIHTKFTRKLAKFHITTFSHKSLNLFRFAVEFIYYFLSALLSFLFFNFFLFLPFLF